MSDKPAHCTWNKMNCDFLLIVWLHQNSVLLFIISSTHISILSDHFPSCRHPLIFFPFVRKEWGLVTLTMLLRTRLCNPITSPLSAMVQWENISIRLMNNTSWLLSHLWAMMHYKHRVHGEGKQVAHCNKHKLSCYLSYHGLWFYISRFDRELCFVRRPNTCQQGLILWYKKCTTKSTNH